MTRANHHIYLTGRDAPMCSSNGQGWAAKSLSELDCPRCLTMLDAVCRRWRVCDHAPDVRAWLAAEQVNVAITFVGTHRAEIRSRDLGSMRMARRILDAAAFPMARDAAVRLVHKPAHLLSLTGAAAKAATELCALAQQHTESRAA